MWENAVWAFEKHGSRREGAERDDIRETEGLLQRSL